jgi:signal transduction histidine kinase
MQWVHQMKTPISVIRLMLQDRTKQLDSFEVLYELDRLQNQMDLMLGLARVGQFKNDLVVEQLSLNALLQDVIQKNKRLFIQKRVFRGWNHAMTSQFAVIENGSPLQ